MTGRILLQAIRPALNDFRVGFTSMVGVGFTSMVGVGFTSMVGAQATKGYRVRVGLDTSDRQRLEVRVRVGLSTSFMATILHKQKNITVTDQK